jgi:hypothetical protein
VPFIEKMCVNAVQLRYSHRHISISCFNKEVVVIGHQYIAVEFDGVDIEAFIYERFF